MKELKNKVVKNKQVSDETIKIFSYKGAVILSFICVIATIVIPALLNQIGINSKMVMVLSTSLIGSLGICYVRNFIDSKKGLTKGVFLQFILFFCAFFIISYYWIFYQYYI